MKALVGALATLLVAAGVPAIANAQSRQDYEAELTSKRPSTSTGFRQTIEYVNPDDPDGKPYAVEQIVFRLPRGSRIDTSVPAQCKASEAEFQLEGEGACPLETQVGNGFLSIDFGAGAGPLPRVVENDVSFFNNEDELILFTESTNTGQPPVRTAGRIEVRRRTFVSRVPPLPGVPPPTPFAAIKNVLNRLEAVTRGSGRAREAYITTPSNCPRSGHWTVTATFTYRDGVVQTERSTTPCLGARPAPPSDPPSDHLEPPDDAGMSDDGRSKGEESSRNTTDLADSNPTDEDADEPSDASTVVGATSGPDHEELPFTGFAVSGLALAGGALAGTGLALRRRASRRLQASPLQERKYTPRRRRTR